ncbi:hypothetical protein BD311DRAFT_754373, partial [Dichomitus squalens]
MQANQHNTQLHPNGKAKIAIRDVARVYGQSQKIPLNAFRSGALARPKPSSMVTPAQVQQASVRASDQAQRASDYQDAMSVLHDIDTQWGALPEGGALEGYGS